MSKTSFRPRQVDYTKQMPVYLNDELPDLHEYTTINRSVPQMPTGMEKEEESEHHLQRALSAQQAFGISSTEYAIPTPKVIIDNKKYEKIYNFEFTKPKQYIRIQPFLNDYELPDYDCDTEDEEWLKSESKLDDVDVLRFEEIMDRLEKATGFSTHLMTFDEAKFILKHEDNDVIKCIYDYWKDKRIKLKHPLTPTVLTDRSGLQTQPNNPYLVFRRRTEKMQTRKNRKNEEQSYEKMLILKRDLMRAQHILSMIRKRENFKKELLKLTLEIFEKRYKSNDYDGSIMESLKVQTPISSSSSIPTHPPSQHHHHHHPQRPLLTTNDKNHSIIDKQIANLIHSNELKTLASPPHSSLKRVHSQMDANYLMNKIVNKNPIATAITNPPPYTTATTNEHNRQKLEKKRLKKQQLQQQQLRLDQSLNVNTNVQTPLKLNSKLNSSKPFGSGSGSAGGGQSRLNLADKISFSHKAIPSSSSFVHISPSLPPPPPPQLLPPPPSSSSHTVVNNTTAPSTCSSVSYQSSLLSNDVNSKNETSDELINYEQIINETLNSLSTSNEKDGYWCFKRKEGCKYLAQSHLIEKKTDIWLNDEQIMNNNNNKRIDVNRAKNRYGYMVGRNNRNLGLLRRRVGRGGRVILDRYDNEKLNNLHRFNFSKIKTYYPKDENIMNENEDVIGLDSRLDNNNAGDDDHHHQHQEQQPQQQQQQKTYDYHLFQYQLEQLNSNKYQNSTKPTAILDRNNNNSLIEDDQLKPRTQDTDEMDCEMNVTDDSNDDHDCRRRGSSGVCVVDSPTDSFVINDDETSIKLFNYINGLNDNYSYKSNDCYLDIISVKFAISTLKVNAAQQQRPDIQQQQQLNTEASKQPQEPQAAAKPEQQQQQQQRKSNNDFDCEHNEENRPYNETQLFETLTQQHNLQKFPLTSQSYTNTQFINNLNNKKQKSPSIGAANTNTNTATATIPPPPPLTSTSKTIKPENIANSSSSPSSSSSSSSTNASPSFKLLNGGLNGVVVNGAGTNTSTTTSDSWNNYSKKPSQKQLLHAFNSNGVNATNNFNVFKLQITDQTAPNLIETSSHKTNGDNIGDNLAMEVT